MAALRGAGTRVTGPSQDESVTCSCGCRRAQRAIRNRSGDSGASPGMRVMLSRKRRGPIAIVRTRVRTSSGRRWVKPASVVARPGRPIRTTRWHSLSRAPSRESTGSTRCGASCPDASRQRVFHCRVSRGAPAESTSALLERHGYSRRPHSSLPPCGHVRHSRVCSIGRRDIGGGSGPVARDVRRDSPSRPG